MVSIDDFPTTYEVVKENQKTRDKIPTIKFLEKFPQFSVKKGERGFDKKFDHILKYHGHIVTMYELAIMNAFMFWNEDSIYPRPKFKGGKLFHDLILPSMDIGFPTQEIIKKTKLVKS